jgi:hypothetical protein
VGRARRLPAHLPLVGRADDVARDRAQHGRGSRGKSGFGGAPRCRKGAVPAPDDSRKFRSQWLPISGSGPDK